MTKTTDFVEIFLSRSDVAQDRANPGSRCASAPEVTDHPATPRDRRKRAQADKLSHPSRPSLRQGVQCQPHDNKNEHAHPRDLKRRRTSAPVGGRGRQPLSGPVVQHPSDYSKQGEEGNWSNEFAHAVILNRRPRFWDGALLVVRPSRLQVQAGRPHHKVGLPLRARIFSVLRIVFRQKRLNWDSPSIRAELGGWRRLI
jgi:hypothetical protein